MPDKLKPCPFCGGEAKFFIRSYENSDTTQLHMIKCENSFDCGAQISDLLSGYQPDYKDCVKKLYQKWNRRVESDL